MGLYLYYHLKTMGNNESTRTYRPILNLQKSDWLLKRKNLLSNQNTMAPGEPRGYMNVAKLIIII